MNQRTGNTTISLKEFLPKIDELTEANSDCNRSHTIRRILQMYFTLKDEGIDLLKMEEKKVIKELKKL